MNEAVERSNKLYEALREYYDAGVDKQIIIEEVENHLDDMMKRRDAFILDLSTLGSDITAFIDCEYFKDYPDLFPRPETCPTDARARLRSNFNYAIAIDHLQKAIVDVLENR